MITQIQVYLNEGGTRKLVDVEVVKEYNTYLMVKLPDGNVIRRKKNRDLVQPKIGV
jgi:hypothetical protein